MGGLFVPLKGREEILDSIFSFWAAGDTTYAFAYKERNRVIIGEMLFHEEVDENSENEKVNGNENGGIGSEQKDDPSFLATQRDSENGHESDEEEEREEE
ncbi:hypothetical protein PsorP6_013924 [Peronosclerospora sorghi]|uniref:Uncharacterized protein n=1 Tax=Peronosclerospora sorghi TaxID=230839 RepID=A0ACC0VIZ4_9STRA|nr:hypothetical protein PsorP6_013924 [Peronosclerospora sorghi]